MPRPSNTDARRREITVALGEVMAHTGYASASIKRIAAAAKLSPGVVHYHFGSKQDILLALVAQLASDLRDRFDRRSSAAASPWDRLEAWIDAHLALGEDSEPTAVALWVTLGTEAIRQPEVQSAVEAILCEDHALLSTILREVLATEHRSTGNLTDLCTSLLASVEGAYRLASLAPSISPPGYAAPTVKLVARGLIASTPREIPS